MTDPDAARDRARLAVLEAAVGRAKNMTDAALMRRVLQTAVITADQAGERAHFDACVAAVGLGGTEGGL